MSKVSQAKLKRIGGGPKWTRKVYHIVRHETRVHCYAGGNPVR